jgi:hypothetical protein
VGDVLDTSASTLHGSVTVKCGVPVTKVEIVGDTGVLHVIQPPSPAKSITGSFDIPRAGLSWIVARATGPVNTWHVIDAAGLFAQTAPVYLEDNSSVLQTDDGPLATGEARLNAVLYFLGRLNELEALYEEEGVFPGPTSQADFEAAVTQARAYYHGLLIPTGVASPALRPAWELTSVWPNPAGSEAHVTYRVPPGGGAHRVDVYDAAGRVVRRLYAGSRAEGDYRLEWNGRDARGTRAASGVYFVRIRPENAAPVAHKLVLVR